MDLWQYRTFETVAALLITAYLIYKWWVRPHKKFPPGVRGFPLFGTFPYLGKYPEKVIARWSCEKYGPVMSIRFGNQDMVVINEYDQLFKAFVQNSSKYADRQTVPVLDEVINNLGFALRPGDNEWKEQRRFAMKMISQYGMGKVKMEDRINFAAKSLTKAVKEQNEEPFNISVLISCTICNIICYFCFGQTYKYDDERLQKVIKTMHGLLDGPVYMGMIMMFPVLRWITPFKQVAETQKRKLQSLIDFAEIEIQRHKAIYDKNDVKDYIDAFWKEQKLRKGKDGFTDQQLRVSFLDFLTAGTDTASNAILWNLICLLHYPQTQKKLHEELDRFYKTGVRRDDDDITPSMNDCAKLPFTMAFIQEVYRFRTLIPLSLQRKTTTDVDLLGFVIPKGTSVAPNIWAIHNDPDLWKNPEIFTPERHIDEDGKFVFSKKIIPFSIGARSCLGEKMARMQNILVSVNLLINFEFLPDPSSSDLPDISEKATGFSCAPHGYKLVAKPRKNIVQ